MLKSCPSCTQNIWRQIEEGGLGLLRVGWGEPVLGVVKSSRLTLLLTEWTQRDLERMENIRFCRQYLVFHDGDSVVFAGPAGNSVETRGE